MTTLLQLGLYKPLFRALLNRFRRQAQSAVTCVRLLKTVSYNAIMLLLKPTELFFRSHAINFFLRHTCPY